MTAVSWALFAALFWGLAPIIEKTGLKGAPPLAGLFYRCVGVLIGMVLLAAFLVKPQEIRSVGVRSALFLIAGGFMASILGQICFYSGLKTGEVSRVVPISGAYPVIAFCLGVLLLGEGFTLLKAAGVACVVLGVCLLRL